GGGRELAEGGAGGGRGARRNRPVGRGDCGRGGRGIPPREADGQHRLRSVVAKADDAGVRRAGACGAAAAPAGREIERSDAKDAHKLRRADGRDRKSTRLNSSHVSISYAVFCLKKKKYDEQSTTRRAAY